MPIGSETTHGNYQITDYGEPVELKGARLRFMVCDGRMRCFGYFTRQEDAELFVWARNEEDKLRARAAADQLEIRIDENTQ